MDLSELRRNYRQSELRRQELRDDPLAQFTDWLEQARAAELVEPNAMVLATCPPSGQPSQRIVLLKRVDERGFAFFTNFESRKAREMAGNASVSLLFPWVTIERQVIITGSVTRLAPEESERYFHSRPLESQLGAWASQQSAPLPDRATLEARFAEVKEQYGEGPVPLPPFWGGYNVRPETIEFWQGGSGRLHDRFCYSRKDGDSWEIVRLSP